MLDIAETIAPKPTFKERHPILSDLPDPSFPKSLVLRLGDMPMGQYNLLINSAFSAVTEYADSPISDIVLSVDTSDEVNLTYITNFLEGSLGNRIQELKAGGISVKWIGDRSKLSKNANENLTNVERETQPGNNLRFHLFLGNGELKVAPFVSVNPEIAEKADPSASLTKKVTVFTTGAIDSAILSFASSPQSSGTP